jgi:hypothetical protein
MGVGIVKSIDFAKALKDLYTATSKVKEVTAEAGTFFAVEEQGAPGGEAFGHAIQRLFSTAYTVKFALKEQGTVDFKVGKLECLYLSDPAETVMSQWRWRMLLRVADAVTAKDLAQAKKMLREKKGLDAAAVKRIRWKEGRAVQVLHVGPYDQVGQTYRQLQAYAEQHALVPKGPAHEIYLSDPRRVAPEKLKTIVRLPVKKG